MSTTTDHLIETADDVSLAGAGGCVDGAGARTTTAPVNGLSSELRRRASSVTWKSSDEAISDGSLPAMRELPS
ncbi:hypothetical protein [Streptomyces sp. NPDC000880]